MSAPDDVIWQCVNHSFCSFKAKIGAEQAFCRNEYNLTGLCLRSACPLANSRYATLREHDGVVYLYIKTAERAHSPKNLWEKIKLHRNYQRALGQISEQLQYFPSKYVVHKCKQRLTKIHQYLIRMRRLRMTARPKIVTTSTKVDKRENRREVKALAAAKLEKSIEKELLQRLKQGVYPDTSDIFNFPQQSYNAALGEVEEEEEEDEEDEMEFVEDFDESDSEVEDIEESGWGAAGALGSDDDDELSGGSESGPESESEEDVPSDSEDDDEEEEEEEDRAPKPKTKKRPAPAAKKPAKRAKPAAAAKKARPRVEVEYEDEEAEPAQAAMAW